MSNAAPSWLDRSEYPFESRYFATPGGNMHYVDEGKGAPIVFVHGVPTWSFLFRRLIRGLRDRHRCVAMDHLGFGLSDKPTGYAYDPMDLAANVERLLDSLGVENPILVVHDWGGPLALPYAFRHRVRGIVLFNTAMWPFDDDRRAKLLARLLASPLYGALDDRYNVSVQWFVPRAMGSRTHATPAVMRHYVAPLATPRDRCGITAIVRGAAAANAWLAVQWQQCELLRPIPALVGWGMRDIVFTPRDLERWTGLFGRAEVHRYERLGHFPPEEAGDDLRATIEAFARTIES